MIKRYLQFITEKLSSKQNYYVDLIIDYLRKNSNYDLYAYEDEFQVNKSDYERELTGKLFLTDKGKAIRFNFDQQRLHCVDMWLNFEFTNDDKLHIQPDYSMLVPTSIIQVMDDFVAFMDGEFDLNEDVDPDVDAEWDINKGTTDFKKAPSEDVKLKTMTILSEVLDESMDIFEAIKSYTNQVAFGISNSLIVSGGAGLGKTSEIKKTLEESRVDFKFYSGDITTAGLYETLFLNRDKKVIVFDDMDSVWNDKSSINLLKAALDTYKEREISRMIKTYFDSSGMSDDDIQAKYDTTSKLPRQFSFEGRIIFITNVNGDDIDPAIISRSLHVDVQLNREEVLDRMRAIMENLYTKIPMDMKEETLEFLDFITGKFESKFPLNIRTLIHALNIRISNNKLEIEVGGTKVPLWQMLIKQYLVKKN